MQYSFRNTLCGLAVVIAAGLLTEQANAQTVNLTENKEVVAPAPAEESTIPEEISLFDEEMSDMSLSDEGLISPAQAAKSAPSDIIPVEGAEKDINVTLDIDESPVDAEVDVEVEKKVTDIPPAEIAHAEVTGKLSGANNDSSFDATISPNISNELFTRMSDLEKQTTLLNLELKKEKVQNEIAAVKAQRLKAIQEEEARKEEEERKKIEWENEQERLRIAEETKLREAEANLEKLRQEKIVKAYKETMLNATQKWIKTNAEVYKKLAKKNSEIDKILSKNKERMSFLNQEAQDLKTKATAAQKAHQNKVTNLESQISILKTRLEAEIEAAKKKIEAAQAQARGHKNPFATTTNADGTTSPAIPETTKMSNEYAIMEIIGQGEELAAKLINMEGDVFMVKVGTTLRNGFTIDEITKTYLSAVREDDKDVLYFSAGGILDQEPVTSDIQLKDNTGKASNKSKANNAPTANVTRGIPSLSQGMFIK